MQINLRSAVCGAYQENAYVVSLEGRDDCVVIDPGDDLYRIRAAIGDKKLAAMLLTHGHFDHILAVPALAAETGAKVYVRAEDLEMLNDPELNAYDADACGLPMPKDIEAETLGERVSAAGLDFAVLHTPGHSKGSCCFWLEEAGLLFSGDTLFCAGFGRMDLHGGSPMDMRDSLRRLFDLPGDVKVCPGHGSSTTIAREKARYRL